MTRKWHGMRLLQVEGVGRTQFLPAIGEDGHGAVGLVVIAFRLRVQDRPASRAEG
jgi:hypothetical protein